MIILAKAYHLIEGHLNMFSINAEKASKLFRNLFNQCGKAFFIADSHFREHLSVELDAGFLKIIHKSGIVSSVASACCRDTSDPKLTEVALLLLSSDVCINEGLCDRLISSLKEL